MRIKLGQAVSKASWLWPHCCRKGAEQPDVQFANWLWPYCWRKRAEQPDLQQCKLPVKEGSRATWRTICTVVSQVALLSFYNIKATVSSLCSLPIPILFQFILIYLNLFWIYLNFIKFLSEKQDHMTKLLGQFWVSSHHPTCDAAYILDKVFIWASGPSWTLY